MTKISSLTALSGSAVDDAADLLPIVDMSETGSARNKKITIDETRIALGLSSADSPQFTAINLGHASDTTLARVSAGVVAIEGINIVTTAGGVTFAADIIVPDEAYDATNWDGNLEAPTKNAIRDKIEALSVGGFTAASTTEQLTGTENAKGSTPDSVAALWEQGSDIPSAGTISIGEGGYFNITGTTTITDIDFGTDKAGRKVWVKFADALILTHNGSTLILPTGANITTAAGDTACFVSEGADAVRCLAYHRASGAALAASGGVLLNTHSPSGAASLDVEDFSGLGYSKIRLELDLAFATDAVGLTIQYKLNGSYQSGAGTYRSSGLKGSSTSASDNTGEVSGTSGKIPVSNATWGIGNQTDENYVATLEFPNAGSSRNKRCYVRGSYGAPSGAGVVFSASATYEGADKGSVLQGVRLAPTSGNFTGTVKVYGEL